MMYIEYERYDYEGYEYYSISYKVCKKTSPRFKCNISKRTMLKVHVQIHFYNKLVHVVIRLSNGGSFLKSEVTIGSQKILF
jgi:hypothetical protein